MVYRIIVSNQLVEHVFRNDTRSPAITVKGGLPANARLVDVAMQRQDASVVLLFEVDDDDGEVQTLFPTYVAERT